jgi:hypothetical protein
MLGPELGIGMTAPFGSLATIDCIFTSGANAVQHELSNTN